MAKFPQADFSAIRNLDNLAGDYVLAVDSAYAPWLYGFTNKKIIAPGMFEYDLWSREGWGRFWFTDDNQERVDLLGKYNISPIYPAPSCSVLKSAGRCWIYIFVGDRYQSLAEKLLADSQFIRVNGWVVKYESGI